MFNTIVIASDGSDYALRAAKAASEMASALQARLIMVHVFEIPVVPVIGGGAAGWIPMPIEPPTHEAQEAVVKHTRTSLKPGVEVEDRRELGYPAPAILRIAEEEKADLIVLGSRGLGAVGRFILGSVSDNVLHHAHCSVLVVK